MQAIKKSNIDYAGSMLRVLSMSFIIICHLGDYYGYNVMAQFFNVGVHVFFLISGYLYGDRDINRPSLWFCNRWLKLSIPSILYLLVYIFAMIIHKRSLPETHQIVFLLLNLQGLNFIFFRMKDLFIGPWFFTDIMGCYILLVIYQKLRRINDRTNAILEYQGGVIPLLIFIGLVLFGVSIDGALIFFIGIVLKQKGVLERKETNKIQKACGYFVAAVLIRIVGKKFFDDTVLYNEIICPLSHIMIACTLLMSIKWLFLQSPGTTERIMTNRFIAYLDRCSLYIYVFHPFFLNGTLFNVLELPLPRGITIIIFCFLTMILSSIMMRFGEWIIRTIEPKCKKLLDA